MPDGLVVLRRGIAFALLGDDMQHFGSAVMLDLAEDTYQTDDVVSVCGTEIPDVETCENVARLLAEHGFEIIVAAEDSLFLILVHEVHFYRQTVEPPAPFVITCAGSEINEILGKTAFERINRHVVIVQNDKEIVFIH